jgi:hypothetical protein
MANSLGLLRSTRLIEWSFGAFHTAFFVLIAFTLLFASDSADDVLGTLNTGVGVGVFVLLWGTTWWTTRRAVRSLKQDGQFYLPPFLDLLGASVKWGAVNGILFLLSLLVFVILFFGVSSALVTNSDSYTRYQIASSIGSALLIGCIGTPIAGIFGGAMGFVLALLDGAIIKIALVLYDVFVVPSPVASIEAKEKIAG